MGFSMLPVESRITKGLFILGAMMIHLLNNMKIFVAINSVIYEVESTETTLAIKDFSSKMYRKQTVAPLQTGIISIIKACTSKN